MKRIRIKNLGPIREVDIDLKKRNVIIGPQSSGKSCLLKTVCYCTWVEKRIQVEQSEEGFIERGYFVRELERFHKLQGYVKTDTYIEYESDFMRFGYDNSTETFSFEWKKKRWDYVRTKVSYIPAERNMVAAIPNWFDIKLADDNIRSFMSDWEVARKSTNKRLEVLNLKVSYHYDEVTKKDSVLFEDIPNHLPLDLTNTSSGLQSLIPLFVHLSYLRNIHNHTESSSISQKSLAESFAENISNGFLKILDRCKNEIEADPDWLKTGKEKLKKIEDDLIELRKHKSEDLIKNFQNYHHCDVFLEEPELNLFPPTQFVLAQWLRAMTEGENASNLFIATHSPYFLTAFLEYKTDHDLAVFLVRREDRGSEFIAASPDQLQDIYDYGIDVFFNLESFWTASNE